jgi:hypothetical protein
MAEVALRDFGEARGLNAAREQPAVDIGKRIGPAGEVGGCAVLDGGVHRVEDLADHLMRVGAIAVRHLVDGGGEEVIADEDNRALKRRGSLAIWFDPDLMWAAKPNGKPGWQPVYSDAAVQTCLTMKVLCGMALRQIEPWERHGSE